MQSKTLGDEAYFSSAVHQPSKDPKYYLKETDSDSVALKEQCQYKDLTSRLTLKKKINAKDWEKLVSGINISTLEKTVSGERRGHYDGPDQIFRIVTAEKEYEIYNVPTESAGYKQLEKLKTELNNLLPQYK